MNRQPEDALEDAALTAALRRGDGVAYAEVYRQLRPRLCGFLRHLGAHPARAEELAQETLLRLARHAASLPPNTRMRPWSFAVARHLWLDERRRLLLAAAHDGWPGHALQVEPPLAPDVATEAARTRLRLDRAIAELSEPLREALSLTAVGGLSAEEAAVVLGIEGAALRQRLARARSALLARLGEEAR